MSTFQGINLVASGWQFASVSVNNGQTELLTSNKVARTPAECHLNGFFANLLKVPVPTADSFQRSEGTVQSQLKGLCLKSSWPSSIDRGTKGWAVPNGIGICHGHGLARPIRACLVDLFTRKTTPIPPVYVTTVPVAAALAILNEMPATDFEHVLIVSGTDQFAEISAVSMKLEDRQFTCRIGSTIEARAGGSEELTLSRLLASIPAVPPHAIWKVISFHDDDQWIQELLLRAISNRVAKAKRIDSNIVKLSSELLSHGAALFAIHQKSGIFNGKNGTSFTKLVVDDVWPRDLGIIIDNGRDSFYWRKVFPAGTPLVSNRCILQFKGLVPSSFQLFEYVGSMTAPGWCRADSEMLSQLRWFGSESLRVPVPNNQSRRTLTVELQQGTQTVSYPRIAGTVHDASS